MNLPDQKMKEKSMKIRNGFVSNSSSSSFIVAIPKTVDVSDPEQVREALFGDKENVYGYECHFSTERVAQTVSDDFSDQNGTLSNIAEYLAQSASEYDFGSFPSYPYYSDYEDKEAHGEAIEEYKRKTEEAATVEADKFASDSPESTHNFFKVTYGDDDGEYYSVLEHGGIFDNVKHIQISHH